jgi:hypothetical protein
MSFSTQSVPPPFIAEGAIVEEGADADIREYG